MKIDASEQRTDNIYELLEFYPKPPLISENAFDEVDAINNSNSNLFQRFLLKLFFVMSNYKTFKKNISQGMEEKLRKTDNQSGILFAPLVSATLSIIDDSRNLVPAERAATLVLGARMFYNDLLKGKLEPDLLDGQILEMGQYPNCFSTSQVIYNKKVCLYKSKKTSQITVIVNKRFFVTDIGTIHSPIKVNDLKMIFDEIINYSKNNSVDGDYNSPGRLTCASNKTQKRIFGELREIEENNEYLEEMKNSFLVVCLDLDQSPESDSESTRVAHIGNVDNRWYHSSLQLIVFGNSKASIVFNFSNNISGNIMMRVASEIQKKATEFLIKENDKNEHIKFTYKELPWKIKSEYIAKANLEINQILDVQESTFYINNINRQFFSDKKINPISIFILALQMAIRKTTFKDMKITQFVSLSKFRCLDLTTAVVTTKENLEFLDAVNRNDISKNELINSLTLAIKSQQIEIRKARKTFPVIYQILFYIQSSLGLKRIYLIILFNILKILLRLSGFFKDKKREVIVSHPTIYSEVPVLGRPGIKIPYIKYFGLHYQIKKQNILITMMPGMKWKVPNKKFIEELEKSLFIIKRILE